MHNCKICNSTINEIDILCTICKYPLKGTGKEQAAYIAKQIVQKSDVEESIKILKNSRIILFVLGFFNIVAPFISLFGLTSLLQFYISIGLGLILIFFGFLTFKKPKIAILIPLVVILIYYLLLIIFAPFMFFTGILWKFIIVIGLGYGYFGARKADKILKENEYLASTLGFRKITNK